LRRRSVIRYVSKVDPTASLDAGAAVRVCLTVTLRRATETNLTSPAVQALVADELPQTVPALSATVVLKAFWAVVSNWARVIPPRMTGLAHRGGCGRWCFATNRRNDIVRRTRLGGPSCVEVTSCAPNVIGKCVHGNRVSSNEELGIWVFRQRLYNVMYMTLYGCRLIDLINRNCINLALVAQRIHEVIATNRKPMIHSQHSWRRPQLGGRWRGGCPCRP
jgi:hypothetical protein